MECAIPHFLFPMGENFSPYWYPFCNDSSFSYYPNPCVFQSPIVAIPGNSLCLQEILKSFDLVCIKKKKWPFPLYLSMPLCWESCAHMNNISKPIAAEWDFRSKSVINEWSICEISTTPNSRHIQKYQQSMQDRRKWSKKPNKTNKTY